MRIISEKTLRNFWQRHPTAEAPLRAWIREVAQADWKTPVDVKGRYPNASIVKDNRAVFNIKGNDFRLVVWINFRHLAVYIKWVGTHVEYDRINVDKVGL